MAKLTGSGMQDRKKVLLAGGLGIAVLALAIHTLFGGAGAPPPLPPPPAFSAAQHRTVARGPAGDEATAAAPITSLDPTLHPELMAGTESYIYTGSGRNIFSADSGPSAAAAAAAIEKVRGPIRPSVPVATAPAGPPGPPAIDLRFFGYSAHRDGVRRAFLKQGDNIFVAGEGDVVGHRYKVVQIAPFSIQIEDLPYHDTQTLPLIRN